jgi:signal peptide peptidase SppA
MPVPRPKTRTVSPYERLALDPKAIQRGPQAFFWLLGPTVAPNERMGDQDQIAVVNIRGALDQFADSYCDNYESIVGRVREAMTGEDVEQGRAIDSDHSDPPSASPPVAVVLRISSPGGVVAGLNETVAKLQAMSAEHGIPLIAYADECAASAAYALACACEAIYTTPSGIVGSIGVISMLESYVRMFQKEGIDLAVIASGERKTDGHPGTPLDEDAIAAERDRIEELALQFFELVSDARDGLSVEDIRGYEAGIFLGEAGKKAGLVDEILSFDGALARLCQVVPTSTKPLRGDMILEALILQT